MAAIMCNIKIVILWV